METMKRISMFALPVVAYGLIQAGAVSAVPRKSLYTSAQVCGECHTQIYERWKNSMHALSAEDPIFDSAYTRAYRASAGKTRYLCPRCHAPTSYKTGDYDFELPITREGVTCDFCHTVKSVDLASREFPYVLDVGDIKRGPLKPGKAAPGGHEVEYSELHTRSIFCAGCHEYTSPEGAPVLTTYSEWLAGPYPAKGVQCQNCHMPLTPGQVTSGGVRSGGSRVINEHNLAGGHSIQQLKKAVRLKIIGVRREGKLLTVRVKVANVGSGHMVPTGLPTRKLVLKVEVRSPRGQPISALSKTYEKALVDGEGRIITEDSHIKWAVRNVLYDNRLMPLEEREEEFNFHLPPGIADSFYVASSIYYLYEPTVLEKQKMEIVLDGDIVETVK